MGFAWKGFNWARDSQKGITIKMVHRFEDVGPSGPLPFRYSQGDLVFEFRAQFRPGPKGRRTAAAYIIEHSIRYGLQRAKCRSLSLGEYQELKRTIRDGMLALVTRGGDEFRYVPDYRLEVVTR